MFRSGEWFATLVECLQARATTMPDREAFAFLTGAKADPIVYTYADLDRYARAIAVALEREGAQGERVLLMFPSGLDFVAAFFGCLYAGAVAVPVYPPRPGRSARRLRSVALDAEARIALTTKPILQLVKMTEASDPSMRGLQWRAVDEMPRDAADAWRDPGVDAGSLAFIQYTSGSTDTPKGVMLTHENLLRNGQLIEHAFDTDVEGLVGVGWLPLYHDMGLIGMVLTAVAVRKHVTLMGPETFLMRPRRWLEAISNAGVVMSGAPNFAYDLCAKKVMAEDKAKLDLSRWRVAFCGAEPVRADTLERFADAFEECGFDRKAFAPCYGLAEATLFVAGPPVDEPLHIHRVSASALAEHDVKPPRDDTDSRALVGCGRAWLHGEVAIVDPDSYRRVSRGVGEIWVKGPSVAAGYWNRPELSESTFRAHIDGEDDAGWLRTGDLGFVAGEHLFVTGRIKDVIIIGGSNHYPQDVEYATEAAHEAVRPGCVAAFANDDGGQERLVICAELRPEELKDGDPAQVGAAIRQAVFDNEGLGVKDVIFLKKGTIPRTSSGKIQRRATKALYLENKLKLA